jgi:hypothetical protein
MKTARFVSGLCAILILAGCSSRFKGNIEIPTSGEAPVGGATIPILSPSFTPSPTIETGVYRGDLHIHTWCSDGHNTYEEMVQAALAARLDFIAITDHLWCEDTVARCKAETRLVCFPGKEISQEVHIVAVGISSPVNRGAVEDVVNHIHEQGGIAIAAHPYRVDKRYSPGMLFGSGFDAMECNFHQDRLLAFDTGDMPCVWDSDAHEAEDIGGYPATITACDMPIKTIDDLKIAIKDGHCQPGN